MVANLSFYNSTVTVGTVNNTDSGPMITHDISHLIPNNNAKVFVLNPIPVESSIVISLDGLILRLSPDGIEGDYTYDSANSTLILLVDNLESDSVLLAIYQEA